MTFSKSEKPKTKIKVKENSKVWVESLSQMYNLNACLAFVFTNGAFLTKVNEGEKCKQTKFVNFQS